MDIFHMKSLLLLAVLVSLFLAGGCVYYNTFYHAKKYYEEGLKKVDKSDGKLTKEAKDDFQNSIKKCVKVLTTYKNSSLADDALLLMGKAFYQKSEYDEAIKTLGKLLEGYPDSDKREEAIYWTAKAQFQGAMYADCLMTMNQYEEAKGTREMTDELGYLQGETYFRMRKYRSSFDRFKRLLDKRSSRWRDEGLLRMAQCQFYMKNYDDALKSFQDLVKSTKDLSLEREGYFWIASSFSEIGRYEEAADAYRSLLEGDLTKSETIRARIGLGRQLTHLGKIEDALEVFKLITLDYPKTAEAAEANYLMGTLDLESLRDNDKAQEEFKKGYRELPQSEYGKKCEEKWKEVERWRKLKSFVEDGSNGTPDGLAQAYYLLAEYDLYQIKDKDAGMKVLRTVVDSFPDSPWAAKADYARAWILEEDYRDTTASRSAYKELISRYPDTRYADFARMKLDMKLPKRPAGFYEDEMEGNLLSAVTIKEGIRLGEEPAPVDTVADSTGASPPDSLPSDESAPGDSVPGG